MTLVLKINDRLRERQLSGFHKATVVLKYNSVGSAFNFQFNFDPDNADHVEFSCVTHFHDALIEYNGERLITGRLINNSFSEAAAPQLSSFAGYSFAGVLEDCEIPASTYPLQYNGLSLRSISEKLFAPFGVGSVVHASVADRMDKPFTVTSATEKQKVKDYLKELCLQRNIVMTHDVFGRVVFTQPNTDKETVLDLDLSKGAPKGVSATMVFNGQGMHSPITVIKQFAFTAAGNAGQESITNPYVLQSIFRPRTVIQSSGDDLDTLEYAKRVLADELRNVGVTITLDSWEGKTGKLLKPGDMVSLICPKIYIFEKTRFFVETVSLELDAQKTVAVLNCVLPEVYNGKEPKNIFQGINIHQ